MKPASNGVAISRAQLHAAGNNSQHKRFYIPQQRSWQEFSLPKYHKNPCFRFVGDIWFYQTLRCTYTITKACFTLPTGDGKRSVQFLLAKKHVSHQQAPSREGEREDVDFAPHWRKSLHGNVIHFDTWYLLVAVLLLGYRRRWCRLLVGFAFFSRNAYC